MKPNFYRINGEQLIICIRLTPKASQNGLGGVAYGAEGKAYLIARVRAVAEDGKANKALLQLLSKQWKLPITTLTLVSGATARYKQVRLTEWDEVLLNRLSLLAK